MDSFLSQCRSEVNDLYLEDEGGVGRDEVTTHGFITVGVLRRASKDGLLSLLELADTFVPASDDLTGTNDEFEGLSTRYGTVKDLTVTLELSGVVNLDHGARGDSRSSSFIKFLYVHICQISFKSIIDMIKIYSVLIVLIYELKG